MHAIELIRRAQRRIAAAAAGVKERNPKYLDSQRILQTAEGQIGTLPSNINVGPLQDSDPASPTFGMFYFMPGYDPPGSGQPFAPP